MKANELRIGNWVNERLIDGTIHPIQLFRIELYEDYDDCSPIPLTPEILEKAGFKKDDGVWKIKSLPCYIFKAAGEEYYICVSAPFKYLHQLQNLYFALTGGELNIEL